MAKLIIEVNNKDKKIILLLKKGSKFTAEEVFDFNPKLDTLLISAIDKFLEKNKLKASDLEKVAIHGKLDKNSSTNKIIETVVKAINIEGF